MGIRYDAVVIGVSAGGMEALRVILSSLPAEFPVPIIVVQHLSPSSDNYLTLLLNDLCRIAVKEAEEKEHPLAGIVYISPPNYHLLIEEDRTFSLSLEERVNYSRPSVDVLFETAAEAYGDRLIGVVLTGANEDGSHGLKTIQDFGGTTVVQDPDTAVADRMPRTALKLIKADYIMTLEEIGPCLIRLLED